MGLRSWARDEKGSSFESFALAMSVIAVLFVAAADLLHYESKRGGFLARMFLKEPTQFASDGPAIRGGIDYTETGSIGLRRPPTLDPCTGAQK